MACFFVLGDLILYLLLEVVQTQQYWSNIAVVPKLLPFRKLFSLHFEVRKTKKNAASVTATFLYFAIMLRHIFSYQVLIKVNVAVKFAVKIKGAAAGTINCLEPFRLHFLFFIFTAVVACGTVFYATNTTTSVHHNHSSVSRNTAHPSTRRERRPPFFCRRPTAQFVAQSQQKNTQTHKNKRRTKQNRKKRNPFEQ